MRMGLYLDDTEKPLSVMKVFNIAVENLTTDQLCMLISSISIRVITQLTKGKVTLSDE